MLRFLRKIRAEDRVRGFEFAPEVTVRAHGDGIVFLHRAKGIVYSCNRVGAELWAGLRGGHSPAAIADRLAQEYSVAADLVARDASRFIAELETAGILLRERI